MLRLEEWIFKVVFLLCYVSNKLFTLDITPSVASKQLYRIQESKAGEHRRIQDHGIP